jgi:nitrate/TMAO reductase-like tetraheme cytochrome c subunit
MRNVIIDFGKKSHRRTVILILVLSVVNLTVFALVMYEAYHFTESDFFCGAICHTVMDPEYTAYQRSPHAKVGCVSCHIGTGAEWYVKAKLSGLRQVKWELQYAHTGTGGTSAAGSGYLRRMSLARKVSWQEG